MRAHRTARRHPGRVFADLYEGNEGFDAHHYRETGAPFIVLKATEGVQHVDAKHRLRARLAHELGLPVCHYHYLDLAPTAMQARNFWTNVLGVWHKDDFLMIDAERGGIGDADNPSGLLKEFDRDLHHLSGRMALGYSEQSFLHEHNLTVMSGKWDVADYGRTPTRPPLGQELWAHQYTDKGQIAGCIAPTDLNVLVAPSAIRYWDR